MLQIVFRSQLTRLLSYADIQRLCLSAALNNRKGGITGFMIECGGVFLVSIEGEAGIVKETLDRILQDPRHDNLKVVFSEDGIERRRFGVWAMNVMFLDDDIFWNTVFGPSVSCEQLLSSRMMEPAFAMGLLAMAHQYACAQARIAPSPTRNQGGRIPRIAHMFRR